MESMIEEERYLQLNRTMLAHRGNVFSMAIKGLDELRISHDNVMFEACNTSFQIHFQVGAERFARLYNLAQAIAGPVLAAAVNSPVFLQHRLWSETRIALFEQAVDSRSEAHLARQAKPRVVFGDRWVRSSVLEIFREDVARFRVILSTDSVESPLEALDRGRLPELRALRLHNGTIYRWNRPCFGVRDGRPQLRIEFRALPAGPTVLDEMANAALFFGLMIALSEEHKDITKVMSFDDAKNNFMMASRYGLKARLHWLGGEMSAAHKLILNRLLPMARDGLRARSVRAGDVDRYLGVIEERTRSGQTGSQWAFDSLAGMEKDSRVEERCRALSAGMYTRHLEGRPVHSWSLADLDSYVDWRDSYRRVSQVMTKDLFTVGPEDLVDLAANLMDWEHIRHVPVEDNNGRLVGLVSHRQLLRLVARGGSKKQAPVAIREIMTTGPITVTPGTPTLEAISLMRERRVSCLPVVDQDDKLVGIVTERDFINAAAKLFESELREK
jgi:CBS domain-containing protein